MENHEINLEKEFKFQEAAATRDKINNLKHLEEQKVLSELQKTHNDQLNQLNSDKESNFRQFNEFYDTENQQITQRYEELQSKMNQDHEDEFNNDMKEFHESYPEHSKKSTETLDLYKKLEGIVKKKE